jgi:hypothetical protein
MLSKELVFDSPDDFEVTGTIKRAGMIMINVESKQIGSNCPGCDKRSFRIHSYYTRTVMDLPVMEK